MTSRPAPIFSTILIQWKISNISQKNQIISRWNRWKLFVCDLAHKLIRTEQLETVPPSSWMFLHFGNLAFCWKFLTGAGVHHPWCFDLIFLTNPPLSLSFNIYIIPSMHSRNNFNHRIVQILSQKNGHRTNLHMIVNSGFLFSSIFRGYINLTLSTLVKVQATFGPVLQGLEDLFRFLAPSFLQTQCLPLLPVST